MVKTVLLVAGGRTTLIELDNRTTSGSVKVPQTVSEQFTPVLINAVTDKSEMLSAAKALVKGLRTVSWRYRSNVMDFRLEHAEVMGNDICTVTCADGKSRTGQHPCVTCVVDGVIFELCC